MAKKTGKNANYNFAVQKDPKVPMGQGDFANMPSSPKFMQFVNKPDYRDGIINGFSCDVSDVSGIYENKRQP